MTSFTYNILSRLTPLKHRSIQSEDTSMSNPNPLIIPAGEPHPCVLALQDLYTLFNENCRHCGRDLKIADVDSQFKSWRAGAQEIPPTTQLSCFRCECSHLTCAGCGEEPRINEQNLFTSVGVVNHCCASGRLFGIWLLLGRFDNSTIDLELKPNPIFKKKPQSRDFQSVPGVGYAGDMYSHMEFMFEDSMDVLPHYAGQLTSHYANHSGGERGNALSKYQQAKDELMIETLRLLVRFLPNSTENASREALLFKSSMIFDRIMDLLRNDSVEDLTKRCAMFHVICTFMSKFSRHQDLVGLFVDEWQRKETSGIVGLSLVGHEGQLYVNGTSSSSLFKATMNTYRQAKIFLKLARKDGAGGSKESKDICEAITGLYELLEVLDHKRNPKPVNREFLDASGVWERYAEENRVTFTDEVLVNHRFATEYEPLKSSSTKERLNTISKEVATMTTSLPLGIFLKVADSRMDVMKVLIIGSEGSPYAGGLFTFDIFLPATYPISPPRMRFVLDGNDSDHHSFNPNLHRGGNVCLSILNTWHGGPSEMWQPNKSTLLSVLISVQAMILGAPLPWLNEPGMETQGGTKLALEHKYLIQAKTIKYAMMNWILNPWKAGTKEHIWKNISQEYWKHNSQQALSYAKEWATENPALLKFGSMGLLKKKGLKKTKTLKGKGKSAAGDEMMSETPGVNLIEKLSQALGIEYIADLVVIKKEKTPERNGKRKLFTQLRGAGSLASDDDFEQGSTVSLHPNKSTKFEHTPEQDPALKWKYTAGRSQKEVRMACKVFGISYNSTIKDSILKLELHVNGKGKASAELSQKYGSMC